MNRICILFLSLFFIFSVSPKANASHLFGADMRYEYLSSAGNNHTYRITFIAYGDCSGASIFAFNPPSQNHAVVRIFKDGNFVQDVTLVRVDSLSNIEITPVCPDEVNNTACSSPAGTLPGIKKFTYALNVVLQGAGDFSFIFYNQLGASTAGRSNQIQNLNPVGFTGLIATLKNTNGQNSSPEFTAPPTPFFCVGKDYTYTLGAVDPNSDLMVFSMAPAAEAIAGAPGVPTLPDVGYLAPYTAAEPFPYAPGTYNFNTVNGQLEFEPANPSASPSFKSIVANKVYEIRNGDTVGSSMREMTFVFLNDCDNTAPADNTGPPNNANPIIDNGVEIIQTCEGQTGHIEFDIYGNDPDGDNITVTWNNLPTGAIGSVINDGTPTPTFHFEWDISTSVAPGDYTFFVTFTDDGCPLSTQKTISKTVRILPFEGGLITGAQAPCKNQTNGSAWLTQSPTDLDDYNIIWTNSFGDTLQVAFGHNGDTLFNLDIGVYNVMAINQNGCSKFFNVGVLEPYYGAKITAADTMGCVNDNFTFTNSSFGDLSNFVWNFGDGSPTTSQNNPSHTYTSSGVFNVTLSGVSSLGCRDTTQIQIYIDTLFVPSFLTRNDSICMGDKITFYPTEGPHVTGATWNFGGNWENTGVVDSITHTFDQAGTYNVTLNVDYRNCPDASYSRTVHVYPYPVVNLGPDSVMCLNGPSITLQNLATNPSGTYRYKWNTGETTPSKVVKETGIYSLTVASIFDCATTEWMEVTKDCYVDIPNSFTPNGDGTNDYFFPRMLLGKSVSTFKMQVFNRWGQVIFETVRSDGRGWDGKFNDKDQPTGVYIYIIDVSFENGKVEHYTGNVTLIR